MIQVKNLTKVFGRNVIAVRSVTFAVKQGHTLAIIGPSGCGKTTTLKMLNRLEEPTEGEVSMLGRNILQQNPVEVRRQIGYVIQGGGLFPHWTVERNVATVPNLLRWPKRRIRDRVSELLDLVGLEGDVYRKRYPLQLSGGQRQRIGIARAMAADPPVILLDEPFSALDAITRRQMQDEFLRLKETVGKTMVFVTHDLAEAFRLADDVLLMRKGKVEQYGTPDEFKSKPASDYVRKFIETELPA